MRKLPLYLALAAALGGATSMVLIAFSPRSPASLPIFVIGMIIALGAASTAMRLLRQPGASK